MDSNRLVTTKGVDLDNYVMVKLKFEQRLSIELKHSIKLNNSMPPFVVPWAMFRFTALT